jgi:RND family efflux transporter MFP subunit
MAVGMMKMKLVLAVLAALAVAACGARRAPAPPPQAVAAAHPLQRDVVDWDDYVGRFEAIQDVQVRPRVSGQITRIAFREGVEVKKGQFLFEIDPRPFRAALAQAQAQAARASATLANARTELARAKDLLAVQSVSREEYEQKLAAERAAAADLEAARAAVRSSALDVEFTSVRSPIDGRVSDKRVSIGDYVTAGQTLLTRVVTTDPIWFSFDGAESFYLKYIRQALAGERPSSRYAPNPVDIKLADETSYRWHGQMSFVDNAIDQASGTIRAHAVVRNPQGLLVPGMFGHARLLASGAYRAMLIPDESIVTDQTRRFVYVVARDNKVAIRNVATGPLVEGLRVVRAGLTPSDMVVLDGLARLQPGAQVAPRPTRIQPRAADDSPTTAAFTTPPSFEATAR